MHFNLILESNDVLSVLQPAIHHAIQILCIKTHFGQGDCSLSHLPANSSYGPPYP
jgi:hypothetical protein